MKWLLVCLAACLAACGTNVSPRADGPKAEFRNGKTLDETAACIVAAFDSRLGRAHHVLTMAPGQIYEVHPTQMLMTGGEPYFARITRETSGSKVQVYDYGGRFTNGGAAADACRD